jgi:hypothetical protein
LGFFFFLVLISLGAQGIVTIQKANIAFANEALEPRSLLEEVVYFLV